MRFNRQRLLAQYLLDHNGVNRSRFPWKLEPATLLVVGLVAAMAMRACEG